MRLVTDNLPAGMVGTVTGDGVKVVLHDNGAVYVSILDNDGNEIAYTRLSDWTDFVDTLLHLNNARFE